jgi:hypothetical protein
MSENHYDAIVIGINSEAKSWERLRDLCKF